MSKAFMALGILILGVVTFGMVNIIQEYSTGDELDYYLLKETTKAAMEDSIDLGYYRRFGNLRMDQEKFKESFMKRFANNVQRSRSYKVSFYDIIETPPKVSVKVENGTLSKVTLQMSGDNPALDIENKLDAIIESLYTNDSIVESVCGEQNKGSNTEKYNICSYENTTNDDYYKIIN